MAETKSSKFRARGNQEYSEADSSRSASLGKLDRALEWYRRALSAADSDDDQASANKNIAKVFLRKAEQATLSRDGTDRGQDYAKATRHLIQALGAGERCKGEGWINNLRRQLDNLMTTAQKELGMLKFVEEVGPVLLTNQVYPGKAELILLLAERQYYVACAAMKNKTSPDFKKALFWLKECHQPIEQVLQKSSLFQRRAEELERKVRKALAKANAYQKLEEGKRLLPQSENHDDVNPEVLFSAIDIFIQVTQMSPGDMMEIEAQAHYQLGEIFDNYFNDKTKASDNYNKCVFCIECLNVKLKPEIYKSAKERIRRIESSIEDNKKKISDHQAQKDIESIQTARKKSEIEFFLHIRQTYPPKGGKKVEIPDGDTYRGLSSQKKANLVTKFLLPYHPDKQKKHGDGNWSLICEEITKQCNGMMEKLRGCG